MNPIEKTLKKLSASERSKIEEIIKLLVSGKTSSMDIKKLRDHENIFRVRKGNIRIIYTKKQDKVIILFVSRRNDTTYNF